MSKYAVTPQIYEKILDMYRRYPGNANRVSLETGVTWTTAAKAWNVGWERKKLRPIKDVLRDEGVLAEGVVAEVQLEGELEQARVEAKRFRDDAQRQARGELERATTLVATKIRGADVLAKARLDELLAKANVGIIESKADRMKMVKDARRSAGALLSFIAETYRDASGLEAKVFEHLETLEPREVIAWVTLRSRLTKEAIEAAQMAVALEDREYGRPDVIVAHTQLALPEALAEIDEAKALADLIREGEQPLLGAPALEMLDTGT